MSPSKQLSQTKSEVVTFTHERLEADARLGMSKVDPLDIRPPAVLMCQALSDKDLFTDARGARAEVGQFFHTGRQTIMDDFEAYYVFAGKSSAINKRKPEDGPKPIYRAIGCMADDLTAFSMTFRSSSLFTLSPLFTATVGLKRPMYAIKVRMEMREVSGEKSKWPVPALKIVGPEEDPVKLEQLHDLALRLDQQSDAVVAEPDDDVPGPTDADRPI